MPRAAAALLDRQPGEVPELHHLGPLRLFLGQPVEGLVEREQVVAGARPGEVDPVQVDPIQRRRRAGRRAFRRAFSTRMRRMASAAAPKKWPRLFHGFVSSPSTRRR